MGQSRIDRARDEITTYLASEATLYGLRSSHAALVAIAESGVGGCIDPDAKMARHIDRNRLDMAKVAATRAAVMRLPAKTRDVLLVACAPVAWRTRVDAACGRGAGILAERHYGDELGLVWAEHGPECMRWGQTKRAAERRGAGARIACALEDYSAARRGAAPARGSGQRHTARARPVAARGRFSLVLEMA